MAAFPPGTGDVDATADSQQEAAWPPADVAQEESIDATLDVIADGGTDVELDSSKDAELDTEPDVTTDAPEDAVPDSQEDAPLDVVVDVPEDTAEADAPGDSPSDAMQDVMVNDAQDAVVQPTCDDPFTPGEFNSPTKLTITGGAHLSTLVTARSGMSPVNAESINPFEHIFPTDGSVTFRMVFVMVAKGGLDANALDTNNFPRLVEYYEASKTYFDDMATTPIDRDALQYRVNVSVYFACYRQVEPIPSGCPASMPAGTFTKIGTQSRLHPPDFPGDERVFVGISLACL